MLAAIHNFLAQVMPDSGSGVTMGFIVLHWLRMENRLSKIEARLDGKRKK